MALIKKWSLGKLGEGPITLDGVTYTQGLDENDKPGIEGYVPTDYVDWEIDNRPLINLVDNDGKLNEHIEINSRQVGNGIFRELGDKFLVTIVDNKFTRSEIYDIVKFKEERFKVINMKLPAGYRYLWADIEDDLIANFNVVRGTETTTDSARWYWKQWVDGNITDDTFDEVDTSTVITNADDRSFVKEILNNRARLEGLTPLHIDSGVAFINGNYSTVRESKAVYDEDSSHIVGSSTHYDTSSGADTLIKDIEDEIKIRYSDATPETWEVTLVITEVDITGTDPHEEYDLHVTIGGNSSQYHGQFIPLIVADFIWDQGEALDLLYAKVFDIGEMLIPNPAQIYDVYQENTPFREYDPRYKVKTAGYAYPQSADPDTIIRQAGRNFACDDKGILPVNNAKIFREFESKETFIDTSAAVSDVADITIPIEGQSLQVELSYEVSSHIEAGEGRWDDFYATWITGYEPADDAVKKIKSIAEFDGAIYFAYHHKLYRLVQNPNLPAPNEGASLDDISTGVDAGEFTFGSIESSSDNRVTGNDADGFNAGDTITAIAAYDEWLYIGTSNGFLFRFQQGGTGADNTIEQVTEAGTPAAFGSVNALYVWAATNQLAIGNNQGFNLLEHSGGNPSNVPILDLGTELPLIGSGPVVSFSETSKYGTGLVQTLLIGTHLNGVYYYGDRNFNSGFRLHHDDNYPNFVNDASGDMHYRTSPPYPSTSFSDNRCTIKKFIRHKTEQDSDMYALVGIDSEDNGCVAWDDDFGHHEPDDDELWKIIDGNNEGDHEHFIFQRMKLYEPRVWAINNLLTNADFEDGEPPTDWAATGAVGGATFTREEGGRFNIYRALMHNVASNTLTASQTYDPSGIGITTYTFSIYLRNDQATSINAEIGIIGLDNTGSPIGGESASSVETLTTQNVWNRYTITKTFSSALVYQARVYVKITAEGDVSIDAAKLEEAASATDFNAGGVTITDFMEDGRACYLNDMISFNNHIIIGGLKDVRGEDGLQMTVPGYSYPTGAPADEEYPNRPDGGIDSSIDTVNGSAINSLDDTIVNYLASNEGLYYIDNMILHNAGYGIDVFDFFEDSSGTIWAGGKARLFKIHGEPEASTSEYVNMVDDENIPTVFRAIIKIPAVDNSIDLIDPTSPTWHDFILTSLLNETQKKGLLKGTVIVRNAPTSRVMYTEGRDYEIEYAPDSPDYGKIKRKPNSLFEGTGNGRIEPDQRVYIEYKYFHILDEISGSVEGYKDLNLENRTATINLPSAVLAVDYELYCDFVYTKEFHGIEDTNPNFGVPVTGIKENLKPYDYVINPPSAHVWVEKFHMIAYSRDQRRHAVYADYQFSIPRIDIIQLNYEWNEDGFVTSITPGIPHESAPPEPNPSVFNDITMEAEIAGSGGSITRRHVWYGFEPTSDAIKMYTMNVSQQDYFLNDIYDKRYYITKLQLWDYYIGIKSDTVAYFPFSRSFVSSNGQYFPDEKVVGDPSTAVVNSSVEPITSDNVCVFVDFPGGFDEQGVYDNEAQFQAYWDYSPDYFGLPTIDEYGVGKWKAIGDPAHDPGVARGIYVVATRSTGISFDNKNAIRVNRNLTISQSFLDGSGDPILTKDIYRFELYYYLENAYNATSSSKLEIRVYYEEEDSTGEQYYNTIRQYVGGTNDLVGDKLDSISVRTESAITPTRIEIITSGWDETDDFGPGSDPDNYVGGTHAVGGGYKAKLNMYLSSPKVYVAGIDTTKFYQGAARFGERIQYPVSISGLGGTLYTKFKPLFRYNFNELDNSSVVLFDSRATSGQENYFQIIYDAKNYNTTDALPITEFSNLGTDANPYPRWPSEGSNYYNSFKVVFFARELNIQQGEIDYKYRSYAVDTNDTNNKTRLKYENNVDFQVFHTFLITWERMDEMYPDANQFSDGYNNYQFRFTLYFDDMDPISKVIIIDPNVISGLSEKFQLGGGWLKESYNPNTQVITWVENTAEGFISELRIDNEAIDHDKAALWSNKKLPFLDANNIPVIEDLLSLTGEIKLISGTTGEYTNLRLNDMFVEGDLYVLGSEVITNVSQMIIEDNMIEVNRIQEFDSEGNWVGVPKISSPVRSGLKSYRHPDQETYDSSFIWNETNDEWQLIELSKSAIVYGDNVLVGASWATQIGTSPSSTGSENYLYATVTKSDNTPTPLYQNSMGTFTFKIQLKSNDGFPFDARIHMVATLHDLSEIENTGSDFEITTSYQETIYRVVYETNDVDQIVIYVEVAEQGHSAADIGHQNEFFAKTTVDASTSEIPNETQDIRLRKTIVAAPIANPGKEAYITFESGKSAIKVQAEDGLYINNDTLSDSMILKGEGDSEANIEMQLRDSSGDYGNLHLNAVRPNYIENITDNSVITTFSGKISGTQEYHLQISKTGHIEPGSDATDVYFSSGNDSLQMLRIDSDANIYFRQAHLTNRSIPNAGTPLISNVIESISLDLNDTEGTQACVRITQDQSGTGAVELAPMVASEIALQNTNNSNGLRYLQTYKITFDGRIAGAPGHTQAVIQHGLSLDLNKMVVVFGANSPMRHIYWDPATTTENALVVRLDDENTMTTTNDIEANWIDPNDGKIDVYCTIMDQVPITSGITMS